MFQWRRVTGIPGEAALHSRQRGWLDPGGVVHGERDPSRGSLRALSYHYNAGWLPTAVQGICDTGKGRNYAEFLIDDYILSPFYLCYDQTGFNQRIPK